MIDFVINSYNQFLDQLPNIIQKYQFKKFFKDSKSHQIRLNLKTNGVKYQPTEIKTAIQSLRQRDKNFATKAQIDMQFVFTLIDKGQDGQQKTFNNSEFYIELPIVTNCQLDPILQQSPRERYDLGQDLTQPGGDIHFAGIPYLVQNTLTYPFNKPIIAPADKDNSIIFANFFYQKDCMFGNSYYTTYNLLKLKDQDKNSCLDLVMNFKQADRLVKKVQIPVFLLFKAYGILTDKEAIDFCNPTNDSNLTYFLIDIIRNGPLHQQILPKSTITQKEAQKKIFDLIRAGSSTDEQLIEAFEKYVSPFDEGQQYCYTLGEIIREIYHSYSTGEFSNRDSLHNKRLKMIGQQIYRELLASLQQSFNSAMYSLQFQIQDFDFYSFDTDNKFQQILDQTMQQMSKNCSNILTKSFVNSSSDTVAPLQKTLNEQKTIILDIMQKRQIAIRSESMGGRVTWNQRKLQYDYYAFICPISTPEGGAATGRYNSPNIYNYVSQVTDPQKVMDYIKSHKYYLKKYQTKTMPIKVNYNTIGFVSFDHFKELYDDLLVWRIKNAFLPTDQIKNIQTYDLLYYKKDTITRKADQLFISIYFDIENPQIGVWTDYGRIMVPIINQSSTNGMSLTKLIQHGILQYVCPDMANNFIAKEFSLAKGKEWRFLPSGLLGEFPSCSPFSGCQKAVRALYSSAQMKQNISLPYTNPQCQMTSQQLVITQPQTDVISTSFNRCLFDSKPMLQMVFLCIKPYTFNQEDAIVANQGYFQRGGSSTSSYKTFASIQDNNEQFVFPQKDLLKKIQNYKLIDHKTSQPETIGQEIQKGDILITKIFNNPQTLEVQNKSVEYDLAYPTKYTVISSINKTLNDKERVVQTQLSRYPAEGDKFVSRNAQKGTIGKIVPEYDLDILDSGIVPTFFGNPAGIMKRETYGQMIEPVMGYYLSQNGQYTLEYGHDEYSPEIMVKLSEMPQLQGYSKYGNRLNMGFMGGTMMYSPQKHLVAQKVYAVNQAAKNKITRQPAQGRKRHGGMRIGNLEQSAFYAQGISQIIKDTAGKDSSDTIWFICKKCGQNHLYHLAEPIKINNQEFNYQCPKCGYLLDSEVQEQGFSFQQTMLQQILDSLGLQLIYQYQ